jgi:tRNA(Ile)-lysidine synthetase-like protein
LLETVRRTIQHYNLIPPGSTLVVGVSGGADSLALLHILRQLRPMLNCHLHVATLDHGLRGSAGADDADYVQHLAESWDMSVTRGRADVRALAAERRLGIETAARLARYDFLADVAHRFGAERIAVAHHADDQAETVLMRLVRGSGTRGLAGMMLQSPVPEHADLRLIRPLLPVTRAEIETYCQEHGLIPRQDATNQDTTLLRNRIRLETLPQLEALNPQIRRVLAQLADSAALDQDYLDEQLRIVMSQSQIYHNSVNIHRHLFATLHPALQRRWIAWAAHQISTLDNLDYQHIVEAVEIGLRGRLGAVALLTGGVRLRVDYTVLVVEMESAASLETGGLLLKTDNHIALQMPGMTPMNGWRLQASLEPIADSVARIAVSESTKLFVRTPRTGDRFAPLGLDGHTQKLNRWMINHKIPRTLRPYIPLLCSENTIVAIMSGAQWIINNHYAVTSDSQRVVYFRVINDG